jgi:hypothetical protein
MMRSVVPLVVLALLVTACETMPWRRKAAQPPAESAPLEEKEPLYEPPIVPEPGLALSPEQRFPDIPLPVHLKEDEARTCVFDTPYIQAGRMVYTSRASINELAQFYIKQCPAADWKLESVIQGGGVELVFVKPGKRLTVSIRSLGVARGGRQLVLVLVPDKTAGGA